MSEVPILPTSKARDRAGRVGVWLIVLAIVMGTAPTWWPHVAPAVWFVLALFNWSPLSKEWQDRISWWLWAIFGVYWLIRFGDALERIERRVERIEDLAEDMAERLGVR